MGHKVYIMPHPISQHILWLWPGRCFGDLRIGIALLGAEKIPIVHREDTLGDRREVSRWKTGLTPDFMPAFSADFP